MHINCGHLVPDDEWVLKSERQKKENARKAAAAKRKLEEAGDASSAPAKKRPRKAPRLTHIKTHKPAKKAEQPEPAPAAEGDHAEATSHPNNNGVIATLGDEAPAPPKLALTKASRKIVKESAKPTRVSARIQEKKAAAVVEEENDNRGEPELPPVAAAGTGTAGTVVNPSIKRSSRVTASNTKVAVTAGGSDASGTNPLPRMTKEPETRELANAQPAGRKAPADRSSKPSVVLLRKSKTESTVKAHAEKAQVQHKKTAATVDDRDATTAAVVTGASKRFGKTANAKREDGKAPTDPSSKAKVTLLLGTKDASAPQADAEQAKPALPSTRARKARKSDENAQVTISAGSTKKEAVLLPVENGGPVPMTAEEDGKPSEAQAVPSRPQRTRRQSQKALESAAQAPKRRQGGKRLAAVAASDELK
ncbi:hypothetical protein OE88DRAFT_1654549 [Heliocybe sulcata]|uniref:Uncharacterized protein n=1 Tax=Heliocybe sulcata TaxID=5364 RepID=A0A5C3N8P5_9AGAM|nr:hypothetical protein OE88DRAFT_1654549 [Heliocybe sulcata]